MFKDYETTVNLGLEDFSAFKYLHTSKNYVTAFLLLYDAIT